MFAALRSALFALCACGSGVVGAGLDAGGLPDRPDAALPADAPPVVTPAACPDDMVLVDGRSCPRVTQVCLRWLDPPGPFGMYRCAEYARDVPCEAPRVPRRFCIDRYEHGAAAGGLPDNRKAWNDARRVCEAEGKRVCWESEWIFACEGEELRPYPYGWTRDSTACNTDQTDLLVPGAPDMLRDLRAPASAHPRCLSGFGVAGMAGNVAEWVSVDPVPDGALVVQKGNWWQPGKIACRDAQAGHDRFYQGVETGFRCCRDGGS